MGTNDKKNQTWKNEHIKRWRVTIGIGVNDLNENQHKPKRERRD